MGEDVFLQNFNQGLLHIEHSRLPEAVTSFQAAAALRPEHPVPWFLLGVTLRTAGRAREAAAALHAALRLRPEHPDTLFHVASTHLELLRPDRALPSLRRLVALQPDRTGAAFTLGGALMALDDPEAAERAFRLAALLQPDDAAVNNNVGAAIMAQRRLGTAVGHFRRAIRLDPARPEHRKNLGVAQLMRGELEEGLREYEWRTRQTVWQWNRAFPGKPAWDGGPLAGRTILVHYEQGLGDSVQFVRYLPLLKARGARTIFECQPVLKRLLASAPGIDALVARGEPLPDFDCCLSLMSLPYRCGARADGIPRDIPYLRADPERTAFWRARVPELVPGQGRAGELRVGIQWRADGGDRSIPLECFEPLSRLPGLRLFSLQRATGLDELERLGGRFGIIDPPDRGDGAEGFLDTAALAACMDLVVACDSVVGHVAGALGKPVFLALPWLGDWRWMDHPDSTPWYPSHRLFRMERRNDWHGVMARVAEAVEEEVRRVRS
ncbi:tetratricopeptide repeat protein [Azospirillum agricola]|uniref:tetratricopeptide repeat protein n=1 Tax=Azospirillum agricola TaxID=1720247 RepID=UPI000A0EED5F|nr:tetratricopeptide repeat protein [Azospirillum agricola]SMH61877.1 Tetratricopeptide repeat-containing protein [Azospirillum lipoferum]